MEAARIKNSVRNTFFGFVFIILQTLFKFVSRTIFIYILGKEYLGLNSLFVSILQVLSLAELGFGTAIVYRMYKPIAENDVNKISALMNAYKRIYHIIGIIILTVGLFLTPFIKYLIAGDYPQDINIYVVFIIFLLNTVSGYFFSYKKSLVFAHQRNDIDSKNASIFFLILSLAQIAVLLIFRNYYIYIILITVFAFGENISITIIANRKFPFNKKGVKLDACERKELSRNVFDLMSHKIGGVLVSASDNIIMSIFLGLGIVAVYGNYFLIITSIVAFLSTIINSVTASIGNSIVTDAAEKNYRDFKNLSFMNYWLTGFCAVCFLVMFQPFINIWIGAEYLLSIEIVILIVASFIFNQARAIVNAYKIASGVFRKDRFRPVAEAAFNIAVSCILAHFMGLAGIIIGTIATYLFIDIPIETFVTYKYYFEKPSKNYFLTFAAVMALIIGVCALTFYVCGILPVSGWWGIIIKLTICLLLPNIIFLLCTFRLPEFNYFIELMRRGFGKIFKKKAAESKSDENAE